MRFDVDIIREGMPEARITRGEAYFANGWVDLVHLAEGEAVGHVRGETGNTYVVRLAGRAMQCSCPDFSENRLACKHVLATALAANGADEAEAREVAQRLSHLVGQLLMEGRDDAEDLVEAAKDDPALLKSLEGAPD